MTLPKAYKPEYGYKYHILCRQHGSNVWEHCDYAEDGKERDYLLNDYREAYRGEYDFLCILLPRKYWK